jgi:hypothetical protein
MAKPLPARDRHALHPALVKYHLARIKLLGKLKTDMAKAVTDEDLVLAAHKYSVKLKLARNKACRILGWAGPMPFGPPRHLELLDMPLVPVDGVLCTARGWHIVSCGFYGMLEATDKPLEPMTWVTTAGTLNLL